MRAGIHAVRNTHILEKQNSTLKTNHLDYQGNSGIPLAVSTDLKASKQTNHKNLPLKKCS